MPTPVTAPGSAVIGGKLYVFSGGAPFPTTTLITQIYDPGTNSWSSGPNMVAGKVWFYGGALDDTGIFAPGGDNPVGIPINDAQLLAGGGCGSPTPTATATATADANGNSNGYADSYGNSDADSHRIPRRATPPPSPTPTSTPQTYADAKAASHAVAASDAISEWVKSYKR